MQTKKGQSIEDASIQMIEDEIGLHEFSEKYESLKSKIESQLETHQKSLDERYEWILKEELQSYLKIKERLESRVKALEEYNKKLGEDIRTRKLRIVLKENQQLKESIKEYELIIESKEKRELELKEAIEKIKEHCKDNGRRSETVFTVWMRELKTILESIGEGEKE